MTVNTPVFHSGDPCSGCGLPVYGVTMTPTVIRYGESLLVAHQGPCTQAVEAWLAARGGVITPSEPSGPSGTSGPWAFIHWYFFGPVRWHFWKIMPLRWLPLFLLLAPIVMLIASLGQPVTH